MKNEAVLGVAPEFSYTDGLKIEDVVVNFNVDDSIIDNSNSKYATVSDEFVGIKRFNVFKYFEDTNMLLPIETFHDIEQNKVYAHTDELGTYCLVDMEKWLASLGIMPETSQMHVMTLSDTPKAITNKVAKGDNLDVIFVIYSNSGFLKYAKTELISASSEIFNEAKKQGVTARIHFVAWNGGLYSNLNTGTQYAENINDATAMINKTTAINTASLTSTDYMLTKAINGIRGELQSNLLENSKKYCFIIDSGCNPACSSTNGGIDALKETGMNFSFIYAPGNANVTYYNALSTNNSTYQMVAGNGRLAFYEFVFDHMFDRKEQVYKIISSSGLVELPEDFGEINYNSNEDYDNDGLTDAEEIYFDALDESGNNIVTVNADGSVTLPSFNECIAVKGTYVEAGLKRFYDEAGESVLSQLDEIKVLPIISDPLSEDGDGDGILDLTEYEIMENGSSSISVFAVRKDQKQKKIDPLKTDTIVKFCNTILTEEGNEFSSQIDDVFKGSEIRPQYTLANEMEISKKENKPYIKYGVMGRQSSPYYLEVYCKLNKDGSVEGNYLRINANVKFSDNLNSGVTLESDEIIYKEDIIQTLKEKWGGTYEGNEYDFYKGLNVETSVCVNLVYEKSNSKKRKIDINNGKYVEETSYSCTYAEINLIDYKKDEISGNPNAKMSLNGIPVITLFTNRKEPISNSKEEFQNKNQILSVSAHEFGHVLGLKDAYGYLNKSNYYVEPISFAEIQYKKGEDIYGTPEAGEMMHRNGVVSANDIEMLIYAKATNDFQFYVPVGRTLNKDSTTKEKYELSKAINAQYIYYAFKNFDNEGLKLEKGKYYYYDSLEDKYVDVSTVTKDELLEILIKDKAYTDKKRDKYIKKYANYINSINNLITKER